MARRCIRSTRAVGRTATSGPVRHEAKARGVTPGSLGKWIAPGPSIVGDPNLVLLDAPIGPILAGDIEQAVQPAGDCQVKGQGVWMRRASVHVLSVPDRLEIAVLGSVGLVAGLLTVGRRHRDASRQLG